MTAARTTRAWIGPTAGIAVFGVATFGPLAPASAQGFFEAIFGGLHRIFEPAVPPRDPYSSMARAPNLLPPQPSGDNGPSRGYCVRTCDGHYFPVQAYPGASAADMCHALCPASTTRVYGGRDIDTAMARDGSRYADLDRAYLYRRLTVAGCTCNGRNQFGLAPIDINRDPTLKPGDVVATGSGLLVYSGMNGSSDFTPVASYAGFARPYREQLSAIRVMRTAPGRPAEMTSSIRPPASADLYDPRRSQIPR